AGAPDAAAIDVFLERHEFPIAEPPRYTFVYRGRVDAVRLRHWIFGLPSSQPFRRLSGTDLWFRTVELPDGSRVEYKLEVLEGGNTRWIEDPLNPQRARDPFGANSVVAARGYVVPDWTKPDPEARAGTLEERVFESVALGGARHVTIYKPARFHERRRYPLLVVQDGRDYLEYANLKVVLDNLIHRLEIPGMIVALTHPDERLREYAGSEAHARFLTEELVPTLEREYPTLGQPGGRGLMGASLGAVAAFGAAVRHPGFYGNLLLQSGSFAFTDIGENPRGPIFDPIVELMNRYRADPVPVARRVFVSVGVYESLVYENRSIVPVLRGAGMEVRYVEARDGHNWENWRDRLREGLSWLFPGPLWMVYE
ncbi:MAG: alpha/beta hydrolase-fold protein, partial [Gemmatimonadota bacterium]